MTVLAVVAAPVQPTQALYGDIHLCQAAWVLERAEYSQVYRQLSSEGKFVILDWQHVGIGSESRTQSLKDFRRAFEIVQPAEVIVPDVLRDREATLESAKKFLKELAPELPRKTRFMFVPQGRDWGEWQVCLREMFEQFIGDVHTIGVPKILGADRRRFFDVFPPRLKSLVEVHFLGVWGGAEDVKGDPRIRSWDTSLPVAAAQNGVLLRDQPSTKFQLDPYKEADSFKTRENVKYLQKLLEV